MTDRLEQTVKLWHLLLTFGVAILGGAASAGAAWATLNNRVTITEERTQGIGRLEKMMQRVGDKFGISFEDIR